MVIFCHLGVAQTTSLSHPAAHRHKTTNCEAACTSWRTRRSATWELRFFVDQRQVGLPSTWCSFAPLF